MRGDPYADTMFFGAMLAAHPLVWALGLTPPALVPPEAACYSARCQIAAELSRSRDAALARAELEHELWRQSTGKVDIRTPHPVARIDVPTCIEMPALDLPGRPAQTIAQTATQADDSAS
jgi:hypothetical protein